MTSSKPRMSWRQWSCIIYLLLTPLLTIYVFLHLIPNNWILGIVTDLIAINFHIKALIAIIEPYHKKESDTFRQPSEKQKKRLDQLREVANIRVSDVWVSNQLKRYMPVIFLGGFRFNRHLIADKTFFSQHSEKEQEAIMIFEAYLAKRYYHVLTMVTVTLPLLLYFFIIAQVERLLIPQLGQWPFILGAVLSIILYSLTLRQFVYRGLRLAIDHTDAETVKNVVEKAVENEGKNRKGVDVNAADILIYPTPAQRLRYIREQ
ncbi:hypothetical protein ACFO0N_00725 [Halobium salinum]|uniref:Peptidase M48 domain-containing protein n=1 Tax=Halobium salinum TaxID=1364940 RepID=A0ABD5P6E2_9EURY|nr:hypothetical protein [Halobium salinum]